MDNIIPFPGKDSDEGGEFHWPEEAREIPPEPTHEIIYIVQGGFFHSFFFAILGSIAAIGLTTLLLLILLMAIA